MVKRFNFIRELDDDGLEDIFDSVKKLTGQFSNKENTAVLQRQIKLPELSGTDSADIEMMHGVLKEIINTIGGKE